MRAYTVDVDGNPTTHNLRTWDDGFGPLWVYLESFGPVGVVRARTWEDAYACVVDEIMDDADPSDPDTYARSYDETAEDGELAEGCYYRGSGVPSNPALRSPIAREDLNGSRLVRLDRAACEAYRVAVRFEEGGAP